jgi:hypothetical protein
MNETSLAIDLRHGTLGILDTQDTNRLGGECRECQVCRDSDWVGATPLVALSRLTILPSVRVP